MMKVTMRGVSSVQQDLAEIEACARQANGPNRHVINALGAQIKSTYRLEETIRKNIRESQNITKAVKDFENSTSYTEKIMIALALTQILLAMVQLF